MKIKLWTVQSQKVVNIIKEKGKYEPDFNKSRYLKIKPDLKDLYSFLLNSYNNVNNTNIKGLVFCFMYTDFESILSIDSYESFKDIICNRKNEISSLWKHFIEENLLVLELEYDLEELLNPLYISINDFQAIMPPITIFPPYTEEEINNIINNLSNGNISLSVIPSIIIQGHVPYIKKENLISVYPIFTIN